MNGHEPVRHIPISSQKLAVEESIPSGKFLRFAMENGPFIVYLPVHLWCFSSSQFTKEASPSSSEAHRPKTLTANQLIFQQVEEDGSDGSCMTNQSRVHLGRPLDFPVVLQLPLLLSPRVSWFFGGIEVKRWEDYGIVLLYRL